VFIFEGEGEKTHVKSVVLIGIKNTQQKRMCTRSIFFEVFPPTFRAQRAQQEWRRQHQDTGTAQEAELNSKGYVTKAQAELINRENFKAQQISNSVGALRNQLHAYGYTIIGAQ
jgi:hypothetical protein